MECVTFPATKLFDHNELLFMTEPMPVSDPDVSRIRLIRDARFLETDRREIALLRGHHNRLDFAYPVAFVRVLGR